VTRRRLWLLIALVPLGIVVIVATAHVAAHSEMKAMAARGEGNGGACTMCHGPKGPPGGTMMGVHPAPWALAADAHGRTLFVATPGTREVVRIDVTSATRAGAWNVGHVVRGLDLAPDGGRLAASFTDVGEVGLLDPATGQVLARVGVGRSPAGVAFDTSGKRLYVANMASQDVSVIDVEAGRELRRVPAGREPFVVRMSPVGRTIGVVSRRAELTRPEALPYSVVTLIDAVRGELQRVVRLESCHMAEGGAFTADGAYLLVPAILARNRLPILQVARGWVMSAVLAVIPVGSGEVKLLPLTEPGEGFPDPSGIALTDDGRTAYVASGGRDRVAVVDVPALLAAAREADAGQVERLSWTRRYVRQVIDVGANPREVLVVGADRAPRLAVSERLADSVALVDLEARALARVPLVAEAPDDLVQQGARNFHSARFAFQHAFSCRSCHPDGHTDGLTYDFDIDGVGKNIVLNRSLQGVAGTAPFKWSGLNPTLQRQCGPRFAMVLTRADPMSESELDQLVAYLHSLRPPPPDPNAGMLGGVRTGAVERGKRLFERSARKDGTSIQPSGRCITCHPPPLFTTRLPADVGTKAPGDKSGLFDIPHLTGVGSKAPYLHDGRALTLEEIWTAPGVGDKHGVVTDLDKADLNDLIEYMKGL